MYANVCACAYEYGYVCVCVCVVCVMSLCERVYDTQIKKNVFKNGCGCVSPEKRMRVIWVEKINRERERGRLSVCV
jgi:hypothetical protein